MCEQITVMVNGRYESFDEIDDLTRAVGLVKLYPEFAGAAIPHDCCLCCVDPEATAKHHGLSVLMDDEFGITMVRPV